MILRTRKEQYLNEIVGNGNTAPRTPYTREELFFADILGEVNAPAPVTRIEIYLAKIANKYSGELPEPVTRVERFLARAAGMDVTIPTPITREEMFWADYAAIAEYTMHGIPPLTFNSIAGTLKNYRIYGNTVNGESVGDRTANLFDEIYPGINGSVRYRAIYVGTGFFTLSSDIPIFYNTANLFLLSGNVSRGASSSVNGVVYGAPRSAESIDGYITIGYRNYSDVDPRDYNTMLNEGSTALPYEPYGYRFPVTVTNGTDTETTNLYLPEQIKMVGDEAEYIDYETQKQHRVRKNLLSKITATYSGDGILLISESDGTVSVNGIATETVFLRLKSAVSYPFDTILSGCAQGGSRGGYYLRAQSALQTLYSDFGNGALIPANTQVFIEIRIQEGTECNNLEFKPMIRKADIEDDTYEPYIENTEVDVTLPALPTLSGTNMLSVGTEVQPSNVYIKYEGER